MEDLEALGKALLSGKNGDALRALAGSPEAQRLGKQMDSAAAEKIIRSGDGAQMRALLQQLLATPEGRSLAKKLSDMGGKL